MHLLSFEILYKSCPKQVSKTWSSCKSLMKATNYHFVNFLRTFSINSLLNTATNCAEFQNIILDYIKRGILYEINIIINIKQVKKLTFLPIPNQFSLLKANSEVCMASSKDSLGVAHQTFYINVFTSVIFSIACNMLIL